MTRLQPTSAEPTAQTPRAVGWFTGLLVITTLVAGLVFSWPLLRFIELDVATAAAIVLLGWGPWAVLVAAIIAIAWFAPVDHRTWQRSLPLHLAACASLTFGVYLLSDVLDPFGFRPRGPVNVRFVPGPEALPPPPEDPSPASASASATPAPPPPPGFRVSRLQPGPDAGPNFAGGPFGFAHPEPNQLARMLLARSFRSGFILPIYLLVVAATQAFRNHRHAVATERQAERSQRQFEQARLFALQSQLQPHFLFNTLNTITSFVEEKPRAAEEMLCTLSALLRRVLTLSEQTEIPLAQELELVDLYLDIQRQRFAERLEVRRTIDQRLLDRPVPPLLLQPIVENAIHHGLSRSTAPACIELRVEEINHRLRLSVIDHHHVATGAETTPRPRETHHGVGLRNLVDRLATLYGDAAELHARPRLDGGHLTEVNLPLRPPPPAPSPLVPCVS